MKRTMTVTGTGSASATPDTVTLTLGVETRRETAERAYSDAGAAATAVAAALRSEGVLEADLRTSGLNLRADSVWAEGQGQKVTGYVATATLHVGLRSPSSAPAVIASAVAAGGDAIRINGLEQGFADASGLIASAQEAAWSDALAKAQRYARLAGAELGGVISVSEQAPAGAPVPVGGLVRAYAAETLPVEAGTSSVSASVRVEWDLVAG